jgi:SAM-dependent methyltransferase
MNLGDYESSIATALTDPLVPYPANHFAFRHVLQAIGDRPAAFIEVGVGEGNAIPLFAGLGHEFWGFDNRPEAVAASKDRMSGMRVDPSRIFQADIRNPATVEQILENKEFDVLVAMGVLPHVESEAEVIANMAKLVRPGGHVFIECRNALFSLTTFNRYTYEFMMERLLPDIGVKMSANVDEDLRRRLEMGIPSSGTSDAKFHVPHEVLAMAVDLGLEDPRIIPFHFHAGMPYLESQDPQGYRQASVLLEDDASGWRGLLLGSAFLLHFRRPEQG